jgi:hypothetical protein
MRPAKMVVTLALGALLSACGVTIDTVPTASPDDIPSSGTDTPSVAAEIPCGAGDLGEFRVRIERGIFGEAFVLESTQESKTYNVVWPSGFYVAATDDGRALFDSGGSRIAGAGELIWIGGGHGGSNTITVCDINGISYGFG